MPDDVDAARAADLLGRVVARVGRDGAPLFAGWRLLDEPRAPKALLLHRINALRELRGATHAAAVLTVGLEPLEALVVQAPAMAKLFEWPEPYPDAAPFAERWKLAEARTDRVFGRRLGVLDDVERDELVEALLKLACDDHRPRRADSRLGRRSHLRTGGHVRGARPGEVSRSRAARRRAADGSQQWYYGEIARPEPRAQCGRGQAARAVQRRPAAVRAHAPRLLRRARARPRHVGRRPARRPQLSELDRVLGPGAESGSRPRRQPCDDQGVQRLARRRVVRRISRIVSSRAASFRLFDVDEAAREVRRLAGKGCTRSRFSENPAGLGMPSIHTDAWDPLFAACCDSGDRAVLPRRLVVDSARRRRPMRRAPVPMSLSSVMAIYTLGDLLWASFWHRFPELRFALTEGDIGWIPYFLWRAEHTLDRHNGWMRSRSAAGTVADGALPRTHPLLLHRRPHRREAARRVQRRQRLLGERLSALRQLVARRARAAGRAARRARRRRRLPDITHENAMRHFQFDPFATSAARAPAPPRRCEQRREMSTGDPIGPPGRRAGPRTWTPDETLTSARGR